MLWVEGLAATLEASSLGVWARNSPVGYPLANLVHLLGLVLLFGGIGIVDLRLVGLFPRLPAGLLAQYLIPGAAIGVALLAVSGFVMFAADAGPLLRSETFRWKIVLIVVALANLAAFHGLWGRRLVEWDRQIPPGAAAMAGASLILWTWAAALGRLIAYS